MIIYFFCKRSSNRKSGKGMDDVLLTASDDKELCHNQRVLFLNLLPELSSDDGEPENNFTDTIYMFRSHTPMPIVPTYAT